RFELMSLDEHLYKYQTTFDAAESAQDNPFAEPVIIYSNIEGGIGIFGGLNRQFRTFEVY
ncbi:MAG: DUF4249 family protein, partial [Bacteroidota bacterium]|nr:DUF4249 family protein [Bacteroidota bacterium]MDX5429929.1 DUF4249 family protein [Bacteroidota bacterium]MDX5468702.1 DUF4249 family protein [Bacteroidota bacterium]